MAKILAIANCTGGSGKTLSAAFIGKHLAAEGKKTLLIDLDWQSTLTKLLGSEIEGYENLHLLTAGDKIKEFEMLPTALSRNLQNLLKPLRNQYDYIVLDCPPVSQILTDAVLTVSDELIIPTRMSATAVFDRKRFLKQVEVIKQYDNPELKVLGFVALSAEDTDVSDFREKYPLLARINFDDAGVPSIAGV